MKTLLTLFVLLLVGFSINAFSYDSTKPVWDQVKTLTCTQTVDTECIDHYCMDKDRPDYKFVIDFNQDQLIFSPNEKAGGRSTSIMFKEHLAGISMSTRITTSEETLNVSLINNQWNFFRTASLYAYEQSYVVVSSGLCVEE
jgi:hypothetical protein